MSTSLLTLSYFIQLIDDVMKEETTDHERLIFNLIERVTNVLNVSSLHTGSCTSITQQNVQQRNQQSRWPSPLTSLVKNDIRNEKLVFDTKISMLKKLKDIIMDSWKYKHIMLLHPPLPASRDRHGEGEKKEMKKNKKKVIQQTEQMMEVSKQTKKKSRECKKHDMYNGSRSKCAICLDAFSNMAFVPCGHVALCEKCASLPTYFEKKNVRNHNTKGSSISDGGKTAVPCPICRKHSWMVMKLYH